MRYEAGIITMLANYPDHLLALKDQMLQEMLLQKVEVAKLGRKVDSEVNTLIIAGLLPKPTPGFITFLGGLPEVANGVLGEKFDPIDLVFGQSSKWRTDEKFGSTYTYTRPPLLWKPATIEHYSRDQVLTYLTYCKAIEQNTALGDELYTTLTSRFEKDELTQQDTYKYTMMLVAAAEAGTTPTHERKTFLLKKLRDLGDEVYQYTEGYNISDLRHWFPGQPYERFDNISITVGDDYRDVKIDQEAIAALLSTLDIKEETARAISKQVNVVNVLTGNLEEMKEDDEFALWLDTQRAEISATMNTQHEQNSKDDADSEYRDQRSRAQWENIDYNERGAILSKLLAQNEAPNLYFGSRVDNLTGKTQTQMDQLRRFWKDNGLAELIGKMCFTFESGYGKRTEFLFQTSEHYRIPTESIAVAGQAMTVVKQIMTSKSTELSETGIDLEYILRDIQKLEQALNGENANGLSMGGIGAHSFREFVTAGLQELVLEEAKLRHSTQIIYSEDGTIATQKGISPTLLSGSMTASQITPTYLEAAAGRVVIISGPNGGGKTVHAMTAIDNLGQAIYGFTPSAKAVTLPRRLREEPFRPGLVVTVGLEEDNQSNIARGSLFQKAAHELGVQLDDAILGLDEPGVGSPTDLRTYLMTAYLLDRSSKGVHTIMTTHQAEAIAEILLVLGQDIADYYYVNPTNHTLESGLAGSFGLEMLAQQGAPAEFIKAVRRLLDAIDAETSVNLSDLSINVEKSDTVGFADETTIMSSEFDEIISYFAQTAHMQEMLTEMKLGFRATLRQDHKVNAIEVARYADMDNTQRIIILEKYNKIVPAIKLIQDLRVQGVRKDNIGTILARLTGSLEYYDGQAAIDIEGVEAEKLNVAVEELRKMAVIDEQKYSQSDAQALLRQISPYDFSNNRADLKDRFIKWRDGGEYSPYEIAAFLTECMDRKKANISSYLINQISSFLVSIYPNLSIEGKQEHFTGVVNDDVFQRNIFYLAAADSIRNKDNSQITFCIPQEQSDGTRNMQLDGAVNIPLLLSLRKEGRTSQYVPLDYAIPSDVPYDAEFFTGVQGGGKTETIRTKMQMQLLRYSTGRVAATEAKMSTPPSRLVGVIKPALSEDTQSSYAAEAKRIIQVLAQLCDGAEVYYDEPSNGTGVNVKVAATAGLAYFVSKAGGSFIATNHENAVYALLDRFKGDQVRQMHLAYAFTDDPTQKYKLQYNTVGGAETFKIAEQQGIPPHIIQLAVQIQGIAERYKQFKDELL